MQTCLDYTERLDLSRLVELNTETLGWAAIFYARAKIPVHPLKPGTKVPATRQGVHDASTDLRRIREYWRENPDHNIGMATGHKFDALDVDTKDGRPGEESLERLRVAGLTVGVWAVASTPSGGRHILFVPSGGGNHSSQTSGLDFRGLGGYIVAPPSHTIEIRKPSGQIEQYQGTYQWEFVEPDARDRPFDWAAAMEHLHGPAPRQPVRPASPSSEYANPGPTVGKLAGICRKVAETSEGGRNSILHWAYCRLVEGDYPPAAYDLVADAARAAGLPDLEIAKTLRYGKAPS